MMPKSPKIFLCHASEDKELVSRVYDELKRTGYRPWLDKEDLLPGQNWREVIPKELRRSDFVIVFLSAFSTTKRGYVQDEFKTALGVLREIPEGEIFVIPVRIDACKIPDQFSDLHYVDFLPDGLERICKAVDNSIAERRNGHQAASPIADGSAADRVLVSPRTFLAEGSKAFGWPFYCFASGSLVMLANGEEVPIEALAVGDEVRAFSQEDDSIRIARVTKVTTATVIEYIEINDGLRITRFHPVFSGNDYVSAECLTLRSQLRSVEGASIPLRSLRIVDSSTTVHTVDLDEDLGFFVNNILVDSSRSLQKLSAGELTRD